MRSSTITSHARRPKNSWFIYTNKVNSYEFCLGYKNTKQRAGPYSISKENSSVKLPFGPHRKCDYITRREKNGGIVNEFVFKNSMGQSIGCNVVLLNNLEKKRD